MALSGLCGGGTTRLWCVSRESDTPPTFPLPPIRAEGEAEAECFRCNRQQRASGLCASPSCQPALASSWTPLQESKPAISVARAHQKRAPRCVLRNPARSSRADLRQCRPSRAPCGARRSGGQSREAGRTVVVRSRSIGGARDDLSPVRVNELGANRELGCAIPFDGVCGVYRESTADGSGEPGGLYRASDQIARAARRRPSACLVAH